ncbi:MAG TPA: hypothetical protein VFZ83_08605 [Acidimicrobiia bacterium]|nr:hypothetical protein [Acidimicrobiia bacterium]
MLSLCIAVYLRAVDRVLTPHDEDGQTTAEYALVLVVAATLGGLVLAWAGKTHAIAKLFDVTIGKVVELAGG